MIELLLGMVFNRRVGNRMRAFAPLSRGATMGVRSPYHEEVADTREFSRKMVD